MAGMFEETKAFNQPLNAWDISSVTDLGGMFAGYWGDCEDESDERVEELEETCDCDTLDDANVFNQPLDSWNTSSVVNMGGMFKVRAIERLLSSSHSQNANFVRPPSFPR